METHGHDRERLDFLCMTQPINTSGPTNLRHRKIFRPDLSDVPGEKHSCARLKPKQWKEEEIHLFSKREVHKAAFVYCFHARMLVEQKRLIMLC